MILQKIYRVVLYHRGPRYFYNFTSNTKDKSVIFYNLSKYFDINESEARYICLKYPVVQKLDETHIRKMILTFNELGLDKGILIQQPLLFSLFPITLTYRFKVLEECGIDNISHTHLMTYLPIVKQKSVRELTQTGYIKPYINVENRLASYMTQWPTSLTTLIYEDANQLTLYTLRLKIIQRYLELVLDLSEEEFHRGIQTYPTIKHRPLQVINESLTILQSQIMIPNKKIKSNLYLIHADPENLKQLIYTCKSVAGIDIKEVIRMHPKIAIKNYTTLMKTKKVLYEYGFDNEAQRRCFDIFTLSAETVKERLERAKSIPEFNVLFKHPRFLKIIHHNKTAMQRLRALYNVDKRCLSLNILSSSTANYEVFEKAPGDKSGKGKDLVFSISQSLQNKYSSSSIRNSLKRHPFWINIPVIHAKLVYERLSKNFSQKDIYENLPILFYPWNKINEILRILNRKTKQTQLYMVQDHLDCTKCNNSQILSLALYMLEKNHYFSGNGVWSVEKTKTPEKLDVKELNLISAVQ